MKNTTSIKFSLLLLAVLFIASCATTEPVPVITIPEPTAEEMEKANEIWKKVDERKKTIESTPEWIADSYNSLKIKSLSTLPTYKYPEYKKFVDNGTVYIINHPGFYAFFQHPRIARKEKSMPGSVMDLFIEKFGESSDTAPNSRHNGKIVSIMREFERIERNFLEYKSTEQKLIIIILPGSYKKYTIFSYKNDADEYMRFINDVTNMSESVLYLESKKPNRGQIIDEDMSTLTDFLQKVGAKNVLLGGEYVGRCQEDFYKQLSESLGSTVTVEIVPELSPVSPDDMNPRMKDLLGPDNKLDISAATYNIRKNTYEKIESVTKLKNLISRLPYERPDGK